MKHVAIVLILLAVSGCTGTTEKSGPSSPQMSAQISPSNPPDEAAAIRILSEINLAQADYIKRNRRYALTYDELIESHLLKEEPSKDATGYQIDLRPAADAESYTVSATPASPAARYFYTDKSGVIRAEQGKQAGASSPPTS
jgi:hypothetical protein